MLHGVQRLSGKLGESVDLDALKADLIRDEGLRLRIYIDTVGKVTVGVGHNLTDRGISKAVCDLMLSEDIADVVAQLDAQLPWWQHLDPIRQRALANLCFNLGISSLLTFSQTLALLKAELYDAAANALSDSLWHRQVGARAIRIENMIRTGVAP